MIKWPASLKEIGDEAFAGCTSLRGDFGNMPEGFEAMGKGVFAGCDLAGVNDATNGTNGTNQTDSVEV